MTCSSLVSLPRIIRGSGGALLLLLALLLSLAALVPARSTNTVASSWKTLSGNPPLVVARGGFSGIAPDSSILAYQFALGASVPDVILWCDVQLTKDGAGICFPDLNLANSSSVAKDFPDRLRTYLVNGNAEEGYFPIDFTYEEIMNITLIQGKGRSDVFNNNNFGILTVEQVMLQLTQPAPIIWLNIQHNAFYTQHKLSMTDYLANVSTKGSVAYISSPEITFLRGISAKFVKTETKIVFRFLLKDEVEPTTNHTYGLLLTNMTFIREFASGILVPKNYIWPDDGSGYLLPHTSVVSDAHKNGLAVYAADFVNDASLTYNYSYDPVVEYLQYVDNGEFSVDGVVSDFPITPSAAIECFTHLNTSDPGKATPLVISNHGASGDYPPCTDSAYMKAIADGANIIDCPVHMSKDGIPFCLCSVNLINCTTIVNSNYSGLMTNVPEIQTSKGIFSFQLTGAQIQSLTPQILNPYWKRDFMRNPKYSHEGHLLKLSDFLALAKGNASVSGVLISIENAAYLAAQGLDIIGKVLEALTNAGYNNQTAQRVLIQSSNSSVLVKVKDSVKYELVYEIVEDIGGATESAIADIKKFADSVVVTKESVFPLNSDFILENATHLVEKFHAEKLFVYVKLFSNEYFSQAYDFLSDPTAEINSFVMTGKIDGVITDFPKTAASYKRNRCLNDKDTPPYMSSVTPGDLLQLLQYPPPPPKAKPELMPSDVIEPPMPAISRPVEVPAASPSATSGDGNVTTMTPPQNSQPKPASQRYPSSLSMLLTAITLLMYKAAY
ncbi:hypothetical protein MLD38_040773 [Melastoma candidum]|nr:hypothetical protein MLD38_040773 [Melastoma candidum]